MRVARTRYTDRTRPKGRKKPKKARTKTTAAALPRFIDNPSSSSNSTSSPTSPQLLLHTHPPSQDYFAFCSTLSIYVYSSPLFQLKRLIAGHDKCISTLVWCRTRSNQFATACHAGVVNIWDIDNKDDCKVHSINVISPVYAMDWDPKNSSTLIISTKSSSVYLWDARKEVRR